MKLFKFFKSLSGLKTQKGFTLIELLVVIGVLGILATGLLATIDPLEQFRKGADSNSKTTALELTNSITRYYAVHGTFPWDTAANGGAGCNGGTAPAPTRVSNVGAVSSFNDCLQQLVTEGELKASFPSQYSILNRLWIVDTTAANSNSKTMTVCYQPTSKSEAHKAETKWAGAAANGGPTVPVASTCDPTVNNNTCYWCTQ